MKVTYQNSMKRKVLEKIQAFAGNVILRQDLKKLGSPRQVSRALEKLVSENILAKLGYGVYAKVTVSKITGKRYLKDGFLDVARETLTRLDISWELSDPELEYNAGTTQQIPMNPATKIKSRFRRKISYQNMELKKQ